jgi:hypothetical protein
MTDLAKHFSIVESLFKEYLFSAVLSEKDKIEIEHYIDHNEFGIALDYALDMYTYKHLKPTKEAANHLARIAEVMKANDALERIEKLETKDY